MKKEPILLIQRMKNPLSLKESFIPPKIPNVFTHITNCLQTYPNDKYAYGNPNYLELRIEYKCMGIDNTGIRFMQPR